MTVSERFWAAIFARLWPVLLLLVLFVAAVFLVKFLMARWKAL